MRKALIGILLAASAAVPFAAAQAQEAEEAQTERYQRVEQRNRARWEQREARQEQRQEVRQERQQQRQERVEHRQEAQQQHGGQQAVDVAQRRERRGGWRGGQGPVQAQPVPQPDHAQQSRQRRGGWGNQGGQDGGWRRNRIESEVNQGWIGDRNDPRMERHRERYERTARENQRNWEREQRQERREDWRNDRRDDRRDWRDDRRDWRQDRRSDRRWDRQWRNDRRYDWQNWRYSNRHIYRQPTYYAPYRNHRYSRFSIGLVLDRLFWDQRYWISDPWQYRLPHAGPGFTWVRYYNDVLLVDTWTGEVVDVIHDFFW